MSSKYRNIFKEKWIDKVSSLLNIDKSTLEKEFDAHYMDSDLIMYNSTSFTDFAMPGADYYLLAPKNFVLQENGAAFWRSEKQPSVIGEGIVMKMAIRQEYKADKNHFKDVGNFIEASKAEVAEKATKIFINSLYGLFGYVRSYFFNIDVADSVTTGGRNIIAVASICNELYGGDFKFYTVAAHLKLIEHVLTENAEELNKLYTLKTATTDMCLKTLLGRYYDNYYAKSILIEKINELTQEQKNLLYYKNNLEEVLMVPEVKAKIQEVLQIAKDNDSLIQVINGSRLVNPSKHPLTKTLVSEINNMIIDLAYGFYYYAGDYVDREYQPDLEHIIRNIKRKKILLMDTDSNVTVLSHEREFLNTHYADIIGDKLDDEQYQHMFMPLLISTWYISSIQHALKLYARQLGIAEKNIPRLDLECEMIMRDTQLTIFKKNYVFTTSIHDFSVREEFENRGVKYKKSDANRYISKKVESVVEDKILAPIEKMDYHDIFKTIKTDLADITDYISSAEFIKHHKTMFKIKDPKTLMWGEARVKSARLWNKLYPDKALEIPGVIGSMKLSIPEDILEDMEKTYPHIFEVLKEQTKEVHIYKFANKIQTKYLKQDKFNYVKSSLQLTEHENSFINRAFNIIASYDNKKTNFDIIRPLIEPLYNEYYSNINKNLKTLFGFEADVNKNIYKNIRAAIDRIALPSDIAEVPEILSIYDGELIDAKMVSDYEHLISPLAQTAGFVVVKNEDKNKCITNVLYEF